MFPICQNICLIFVAPLGDTPDLYVNYVLFHFEQLTYNFNLVQLKAHHCYNTSLPLSLVIPFLNLYLVIVWADSCRQEYRRSLNIDNFRPKFRALHSIDC